MPLIKPNEGENRSNFVARCMADSNNMKEFPEPSDRVKYCQIVYTDSVDEKMWKNRYDEEGIK